MYVYDVPIYMMYLNMMYVWVSILWAKGRKISLVMANGYLRVEPNFLWNFDQRVTKAMSHLKLKFYTK